MKRTSSTTLALPCMLLALCTACCGSLPSDEELIAHYGKHKELFTAISERIENQRTIYPSDPDVSRIGVEETRYFGLGQDNMRIWLIHTKRGWTHLGTAKGYAYLARPPENRLVNSLNFRGGRQGHAYRHIDGNWYLMFTAL